MADLVTNVFEISLVTSVLIAVLLLLSPLLDKKYAAKSLCIMWLVITLRLLVPVNLHLIQPVIRIPVPVQTETAAPADKTPSSPGLHVPPDMTALPSNSSNPEPPILFSLTSLSTAAAFVWAAGAFIFISQRLCGYYLLRRNVRRFSRPVDDSRITDLFGTILDEMRISAGAITVRWYPKAHSPMMTGFLRPVILLPETGYLDFGELELILKHELVHYKRRDIWLKLLLTCGEAVHWFNPLVYLMTLEAEKQIENACDQQIVNGCDLLLREKYSASILSAMTQDHIRHHGMSTYFHGGLKAMKSRFKNIFDLTVKKRGTPIVIAVLMLVLVSGTLVACQTSAGVSPSAAPSASPSASAGTASPSTASNDEEKALDLSKAWAEAVKNRDGKAQYALYTAALQKSVYNSYTGLNWVTGTSSPWVESYTSKLTESGAAVTFQYATSTGPAGEYHVQLKFATEENTLKISEISNQELILGGAASVSDGPSASVPKFSSLVGLLGMSKDDLLAALNEKPSTVDEGGLGFDKTGIRIWFDTKTYTKVAQVLIMSDQIDIDGLKLGDSYKDFKAKLGEPISDKNGDAHFRYGDVFLSVVRDTATDQTIAVYILAEDF